MAAFARGVLLILLRLGNEAEAIRRMPWSVILMVCGVTVLISLLEKTRGTSTCSPPAGVFPSRPLDHRRHRICDGTGFGL